MPLAQCTTPCQVYYIMLASSNNKLQNYVNEFLNLFSLVQTVWHRHFQPQPPKDEKKRSLPGFRPLSLKIYISDTWQHEREGERAERGAAVQVEQTRKQTKK